MGSVGKSAGDGRNTLCTWYEARKWLDTRMIALRLAVETQLASLDPVGFAVFLRRHARAWDTARLKLKAVLLPQRAKRGKYSQVRTVNPKVGGKEKVKPSHSIKARHARGVSQIKRRRFGAVKVRHKSKRSRYRSHHPFNEKTGQGYRKIQEGPGRPRQAPEVSKRKAKKRDRKKELRRRSKVREARKKKGLKVYYRRSPEARKRWEKKKKASKKAWAAARAEWRKVEKRKWASRPENIRRVFTIETRFRRLNDERVNHHPEHLYRSPRQRQRARNGSARHYHRHARLALGRRLLVGVAGAVRAWSANRRRALHLRGYWKEVARLRKF